MISQRVQALREAFSAAGCDAYFSVAPPLNQYLAGFQGTTSGVVVTLTEAYFLCDFRYTEQAATQVDSLFAVEEVKGPLPERLGEHLTALGVKQAGFDAPYLTVSEMGAIQKGYEGGLRPSDGLVSRLRQVKSAEEIEQVRRASELAESAFADVLAQLEPGVEERQVAALLEYEFKRGGASGASFDTIALFGARSSLPHGQPGSRRLERGDIVLLDFGCRMEGYCSDLTRTYAFGRIPGPWFEEIYELTLTAQKLAIEAVRPGLSCRELDAVARDLISEAGHAAHFGHGLGHGLGIEIHEGPRLNPLSESALEPGMIVTIEPGVYLPGQGGVRIEDVVAVTPEGGQVLSTTPKDLRILGT